MTETINTTNVGELVQTAHDAFVSARGASPSERAGWLMAIADELEEGSESLIGLAHDESHLPIPRLTGELTRTAFQLRLLAAELASGRPLEAVIDHADASWGMGPRPDIRRVNEPLGVVAVFGASNFPFAFSVLGGDTASALAAGCAVVHKVNPAHPRLARATWELAVAALDRAGAPAGLLGLAVDPDAGGALVDHPQVSAVGFTGSTRGGLALAARAAARAIPIPFFGELGSTNPVFVTEDAWNDRHDEIIGGFVGSASLGMGQFCTKPGFLVVPAGARGDLITGLEASVPNPAHPMLSTALRDGFLGSLDAVTERPGVTVLAEWPSSPTVPGLTVLGTSGATVLAEPTVLQAEMFGPAAVIVEYTDAQEMLDLAHAIGGQLTAGVQAAVDERGPLVEALLATLGDRAGRVLWNGWPTGVTVSWAQVHGGPFPATTASSSTSVGTRAIGRFMRPVARQDVPDELLPLALRDSNPWNIDRTVDGRTVISVD